MFCEKCGTQNTDSAKFCAGCGAPLQISQPQQFNAAPRHSRSVGAIVVYMIAGAVGVLSLLMPFLPQVTYFYYFGSYYNANVLVLLFNGFFNSNDTLRSALAVFIALFVAGIAITMILQLVWAILSFVRVRAAGVLGLIASIIGINVYGAWAGLLNRMHCATPVPYVMVALSAAGLVLSIIQLTKKNRVR